MISIQLGNYSNFVGTQLFNLQCPSDPSSIDVPPSLLWRQTKKKGMTPRVLMVDSKEHVVRNKPSQNPPPSTSGPSKNAPKKTENKDSSSTDPQLWEGRIDRIFQENSSSASSGWIDSVAGWTVDTDAIFTLPDHSYSNETAGINSFSQGIEVYKEMQNDVEDYLRKYAEEIDNFKGFLVLSDQLDGFSGLCGGVLSHIVDEYDKKSCLTFPLAPSALKTPSNSAVEDQGKNSRPFKTQMTNIALLWNSCNSSASIFSSLSLAQDIFTTELKPRSIPNLNYQASSDFSTGGILAAVLETLLSPCLSVADADINPSGLASFLGAYNRKLFSVSCAFPLPFEFRRDSFFKYLQTERLDALQNFTPGLIDSMELEKSTGNYFSARGILNKNIITEQERRSITFGRGSRQISNAESCLMEFASECFSKSVNLVHTTEIPVRINSQSFPKVLEENALNSFHIGKKYANGIVSTWELSCLGSGQNSVEVGGIIENLLAEVPGHSKREGKVTQTLLSANDLGVEVDDYMEAIDNLTTLRESYEN